MAQKEKKKGVIIMTTDGIGRIFGGNNFGVGGYLPQRKDEAKEEQPQVNVNNYEETQVEPSRVMDFLAANNFFVAPTREAASVGEVDSATQERIAGYMENFELIYGVIVQEFGEDIAPDVMDIAMDYLMGMAA